MGPLPIPRNSLLLICDLAHRVGMFFRAALKPRSHSSEGEEEHLGVLADLVVTDLGLLKSELGKCRKPVEFTDICNAMMALEKACIQLGQQATKAEHHSAI